MYYCTELCNRQIQYEDCWLVVVLCVFLVTWMYHGGGLISNHTVVVCVAGFVTLFHIEVCLHYTLFWGSVYYTGWGAYALLGGNY